jgi:hypothetical protein
MGVPMVSLWSLCCSSLCPSALWYLGPLVPLASLKKSFSCLLSQQCSGQISTPDRRTQDGAIQCIACKTLNFLICCSLWPVGPPSSAFVLLSPLPSSLSTWLSLRPHETDSMGTHTAQHWFTGFWSAPHPAFLLVLLSCVKISQ